MFIFAVAFVHVTKKIAMRTLHIRAKPLAVSLLAAVSAVVVWTSVISMRTMAKVPARFAHRNIAVNVCFLNIIFVIGFLSIVVVFVVVIINIAIGIVVIITHVVGLMVISSVESIAFLVIIVGMPIAVSSHGRIALNMVLLGLTLTTDHLLLELGCLTCARRVSDALAFATRTERAFRTLLSMTCYVAQRAVIRTIAAASAMRL